MVLLRHLGQPWGAVVSYIGIYALGQPRHVWLPGWSHVVMLSAGY
jgi:hypothetical protein